MQSVIQDQKAIEIAHEFYLALMDGYPVDAALVEGRKAVFNTHEMAEWGTPVLFMRAPDGEIFKRTEEINLEPDEEFFTSGSLTDEEGKIRQNYRILIDKPYQDS